MKFPFRTYLMYLIPALVVVFGFAQIDTAITQSPDSEIHLAVADQIAGNQADEISGLPAGYGFLTGLITKTGLTSTQDAALILNLILLCIAQFFVWQIFFWQARLVNLLFLSPPVIAVFSGFSGDALFMASTLGFTAGIIRFYDSGKISWLIVCAVASMFAFWSSFHGFILLVLLFMISGGYYYIGKRRRAFYTMTVSLTGVILFSFVLWINQVITGVSSLGLLQVPELSLLPGFLVQYAAGVLGELNPFLTVISNSAILFIVTFFASFAFLAWFAERFEPDLIRSPFRLNIIISKMTALLSLTGLLFLPLIETFDGYHFRHFTTAAFLFVGSVLTIFTYRVSISGFRVFQIILLCWLGLAIAYHLV